MYYTTNPLTRDSKQTSIGTGYDLANSIFSPDGRNFQVEYAVKAVENGGTSVGIRCKDGVVLAVEKVVTSKLLKPGANKRIATVDKHLGVVCCTIYTRKNEPWKRLDLY
jgi:20S proteasome subunit alpha 7